MDTSYSIDRNRRNYTIPVIILILILIVIGGGLLLIKSRSRFISPLPDVPAVEIIFNTPTPGPVTPSSTPSATLKATPKPKATSTPKAEPTATPKSEATSSADKNP